MDYCPLLKRQPKVNSRPRASLSYRSPIKALHAIPEDSVYDIRPSFEYVDSPSRTRDITPTSTVAIKRGSRTLSIPRISLESNSGEDYLCRTPPRPAPSPPCAIPEPSTPPSPLSPMAFSNSSPTSPVTYAFHTPPPSSPTSSESTYSQSSLPSTPKNDTVCLPITLPLNIQKRSPSPSPEVSQDEPVEDEISFYAEDLSSFIRVFAPSPSAPTSSRPDSIFIAREAKPGKAGPNSALDPTYPHTQKKLRRSAVVIPSYSPPPVPTTPSTPITPRSAPGPSRSPVFAVNRPPPRTSLPTGFDEFEVVWVEDEDEEVHHVVDARRPTPSYIPNDVCDFEDDEHHIEARPEPEFTLLAPLEPEPTSELAAKLLDEVKEQTQVLEEIVSSTREQFPEVPQSPTSPVSVLSFEDALASAASDINSIAPFLDYEDQAFPNPPSLDELEPTLKSKFSTSTIGSDSPKSKSKWKGGKLRLYLKRGSVALSTKSSATPYTPFDSSSSFWVTSPPAIPQTPLSRPYYSASISEDSHCNDDWEDDLRRSMVPIEAFLRR